MTSAYSKRRRPSPSVSSFPHVPSQQHPPTEQKVQSLRQSRPSSIHSQSGRPRSRSQSHSQLHSPLNQSQPISRSNLAHDGVAITDVNSVLPSFRPGNLVRIEMKNFLTFTNTVFKPGPRMNLVIGPNGTGKSTIVSAVCIVFGGKPNILGRNPDLGAFVKYGASKASIEAWVHEPAVPNNYISVKREFDTEGKGQFFLNGEHVRLKEVMEKIVSKYDIQLDNLSQFMPQEKIAEFTNHKPEELLKLAIRSLGGADREEEYYDLMEEGSKLVNHTEKLKGNQEALAKLQEEQEGDRNEVAAYREQQSLTEKLMLLKRFRPTVDEIETRYTYSNIRQKMRKVEEGLKIMENDLHERTSGPINACKQTLDIARGAYDTLKASAQDFQGQNEAFYLKVSHISSSLHQSLSQLKDVKASAERARKSVEIAEAKLAQAKEVYQRSMEVPDSQIENELEILSQKRVELRDRIRQEGANIRPLEDVRQDAGRKVRHFGQRLEGLADVRRQRLQRLHRDRGERIISVAQLIREMVSENQFERRVYGPVLAEIEVDDPYHARIMEHAVSGWMTTAFVTESGKDSRRLLAACRNRFGGWKPDVMTTPTTRNDEIDFEAINRMKPPRVIDRELLELGITGTVSEIYRAPDAVRAALNAQASLHNVYVGDERAMRNQETLRRMEGLPAWYTPETRCMLSGSRFDPRARNMRVDTSFANVRGDVYQGSMMETQKLRDEFSRRVREEEKRMEDAGNQLQDIKHRQDQITVKLREIENEIRSISDQRAARRRKLQDVEHCERHLEEMKERATRQNEQRVRDTLKVTVGDLENEATTVLRDIADGTKLLAETLGKMDEALLNRICAERALSAEHAKHADVTKLIEEKRNEREEMKQERDRLKLEWRRKKEIASQSMSGDELQNHEELLFPFSARPLQHLDAEIENLEGQIQGLASNGRSILDTFELRENKIKRLQQEIRSLEEWYGERHGDLARRKDEFLQWLEAGIGRMREKFSSLYTRLGCSGDIRLTNVDGYNLKDLTLQVLVSYRHDVELRPVSAMANSGGEKMCCTMIFCFSLQLEQERIPPFVMVDELNQGLDPTNEMKIMTMMIEDAAKETGPQSFVVTPKLLSNLPLGSCTKTHIIFNGPVKGKDDFLSR